MFHHCLLNSPIYSHPTSTPVSTRITSTNMSWGWLGSSGNSSLAWSMGNGGKGRLVLEFPFPLDKGWYQEQSCTQFQTFEHRKERKGFQHEFIVLKLVNGSVCRIERMGDPDARFDALSQRGSVAYDMMQCFQSENEAYLTTSDVVAEVTLPCTFDLMDILKICRAIHEGGKTRNYTLQVFNCYFFSLAIQVCLTRLVAHWEDGAALVDWLLALRDVLEALPEQLRPPAELPSLGEEPICFRLYYILVQGECYSGSISLLLNKIKCNFQDQIAGLKDFNVCEELACRINTVLWYSSMHSSLDQFIEEKCQEIFNGILIESVNACVTVLPPSASTSHESLKNLRRQLLLLLAKLFPLARSAMDSNITYVSRPSPTSRRVMMKPVHQPDSWFGNKEAKISILNFEGQPVAQITRDTMANWYRWIIKHFPYLALWILHTFLGIWGITVFTPGTNVAHCVFFEEGLGDILTELECLEPITHSDLERLVNQPCGMTQNQVAIWKKSPCADICDYIKQQVSVDILKSIEEHKPKVKFRSKEQPEFMETNISDFQRHIFGRIVAHAQAVERAWLGSASKIQTELEDMLSQVWGLIREENIVGKVS
ncbi:unnamed protein product [Rhizoctonia solani]|uniref:Uncharacterized protein n=1 Tax=Rhizoctonia solani TaxID=456999 RepID=A0A8H3DGP4_9AGAM|nr:unnamed protein product [Rhizoctonia solani]